MNVTQRNAHLVDSLVQSRVYQEYERAFNETTGMPLCLRPVETWRLSHHGRRKENPFCALLAGRSRSCAACLQVQQDITDGAQEQPCTVSCHAGLSDTAVPVRLGGEVIGVLQTGQVFTRKPTEAQFNRAWAQLEEWGVDLDRESLKDAFFQSPVIVKRQYEAMVQMLRTFAEHLSMVSNQIAVQREKAEPAVITRAKQFIQAHHAEPLSLGQVAKSVNTSTFYFCKMFKKSTGLNFTDYLSRVRVEKARNLLLNPNLRVSEIAFEVGFQSLTHFNRVFKKTLGLSPTEYRANLPAA